MNLLRLALLFCPSEFRDEYAAQICEDQRAHGGAIFAAAFDTFVAGWTMRLEGIGRDISLAMRTLLKERSFMITAVFAIAIAAAANIALAGVVNGVLLKPLPFPQPDQLVFVDIGPTADDTLSYPELRDVVQRSTVFQALGISHRDTGAFQRGGITVGLQGRQIAGQYFETFGMRPELGRLLTSGDLGKALVVISDATWRRYYNGDASAIGARMRLGGESYTVVGVVPAAFRDPRPSGLLDPAYWIPVNPTVSGCIDRGCHAYVAVARMRGSVTLGAANADLRRVSSATARTYPTFYRHSLLGSVHSVLDTIVGPVRWLLWMLYAAAALVILIACANVANMQLVRAALRESQIAVYLTLGAPRSRIVRQLSMESAALAVTGSVLGLLLASLVLHAFSFAGAALLPRWEAVSIDWHVALYAVVLTVFITALTGTVPAMVFARHAARSVRSAGKSSERPGHIAFRAALVSAEIALAFALIVSAGLTVRSFVALTHTNVGFNGNGLYDAYFGFLPDARYAAAASRRDFAALAQQKIVRIQGIASATVSNGAPFADENSTNLRVAGRPELPDEVDFYTVDPAFFRTMQIPILRGRGIMAGDTERSIPAIVLNASAAKRYFGTLDVIGRVVTPGMCGGEDPCARTIVGIAGDTRDSFASAPTPTAYAPIAQMPIVSHVLFRTNAGAPLPAAAITQALAQTDPLLVPPTITPFSEIFRQDSIGSETASLFFGGFAFIALVLALAGVQAVTAFSVAARTREFGIRKAIGATDGHILLNVISRAILQAALGGIAGLLLAAASSQALAGLLYRVSPMDVPTFALVFVLVLVCSVGAALASAVRATRVPPAQALRYE